MEKGTGLGFIALHRELLHSSAFDDSLTLKVWIWCLLKASFVEHDFILESQVIHLLAGQFVTGRFSAVKELKITQSKYRGRIAVLERTQRISVKTTNKYSIITIINWDYYQGGWKDLTNKPPTDSQQIATYNKGNNGNNALGEQSSQLLDLKGKDPMTWTPKTSDNFEEGFVDSEGDGSLSQEKRPSTRKYPNAPAVRKIFLEVLGKNPLDWNKNKTQLTSCENLVAEHSLEEIKEALQKFVTVKDQPYCPQVSTPHDLDSKWDKLQLVKVVTKPISQVDAASEIRL